MQSVHGNDQVQVLGYRSVLEERRGPTALGVLGGIGALGLALLAAGLTIGCLVAMEVVMTSPAAPTSGGPVVRVLGGVVLLVMAVVGGVACAGLFKTAVSCFNGAGESRSPERLTRRSREALARGNREAIARGASSLDAQHILLGLLLTSPSTAMSLLTAMKIDVTKILERLDAAEPVRNASSKPGSYVLPPTERCTGVVARAVFLGCSDIPGPVGTEHLLLALLEERDGRVADALSATELNAKMVNAELERLREGLPLGQTPEAMEIDLPGGGD